MRSLNELSNNRQVCLVRNPNSMSSAVLGRSLSLTQSGLCVSVFLNTQATTVAIQRGKKLGYALPLNTDYQDCLQKRLNELKSFKKVISMK